MADYTPLEIVNMIKVLGECQDNYRAAERRYAEKYPDARHPDRKAIKRLVSRAEQGNLKRKRRKTGSREQIVLGVLALVADDPHISTRQIERRHGVLRPTVNRILKNFKFHPYHVRLTHGLELGDDRRRLNFCRWAANRMHQDPFFFDKCLFTDEAKFDNMGGVNLHNAHYYSQVNPHWQRDHRVQRRWSFNVWGGIIGNNVIGPFFYNNNLNGPFYLNILQNEVPALLEEVPIALRQIMWFQQDGAPAHRTRLVRTFLNDTYPNRWIGIGSQVHEWPARSPDLTPIDFFLWGAVKEQVFAEAPTTIEDMQDRIRRAFESITVETLERVRLSFRQRINLCIQENGRLIEHLF